METILRAFALHNPLRATNTGLNAHERDTLAVLRGYVPTNLDNWYIGHGDRHADMATQLEARVERIRCQFCGTAHAFAEKRTAAELTSLLAHDASVQITQFTQNDALICDLDLIVALSGDKDQYRQFGPNFSVYTIACSERRIIKVTLEAIVRI